MKEMNSNDRKTSPKVSVLLVIHGYPPEYSAGSEVYTQTLAHGLHQQGLRVGVVSSVENPFEKDFTIIPRQDEAIPEIPVYLINHARPNLRFEHSAMNKAFLHILEKQKPNVVHFGHLSKLSFGMVRVAKEFGAKVVFTLHDFWLACPRGQFLHWGITPTEEPFQTCDGFESKKCAEKCLNRVMSGLPSAEMEDLISVKRYVELRQKSVKEDVCDLVDLFVSPSEHLINRMVKELPVLKTKTVVHDYGFHLDRLPTRAADFQAEPGRLVFGFTGRHHPSKGIDLLIKAFRAMKNYKDSILRIWGSPDGSLTPSLKKFHENDPRIQFMGPYKNEDVFEKVFLKCDVVVVPSIWDENSPLVIHEAQQCRVPVITSECGGMGEFVVHGVNGFTFKHRDVESLRDALDMAVKDRADLAQLARRGYLNSSDGNVIDCKEDAQFMVGWYRRLLEAPARFPLAPWRITFDTNVTECNLNCLMCENFSPFNEHRQEFCHEKRIMSIEVVRDVIHECRYLGLKEIIPSTMGEPLLYEDFDEIVGLCQKYGLKLNLTTNGTFPDVKGRTAKEWAELVCPVLSDVKISWNGSKAEIQEKIMKGSKWAKRVTDLDEFLEVSRKYPCTVTLQVTFMESNLEDLPNLIRFAGKRGIHRVKGHQLWVFYPQMAEENLARSVDSRRRWNAILPECHAIAKEYNVKLDNFHRLDEADQTVVRDDYVCPFVGQEGWINPEGFFAPCCAPDEQRRSLGEFGSVHLQQSSFLDLWHSSTLRNLWANYKHEYELCKTCLLRRPAPTTTQTAIVTKNQPFTRFLALPWGLFGVSWFASWLKYSVAFLLPVPASSGTEKKWKVTKASLDGTHHVWLATEKPVYPQRFLSVLSFHEPGLAAVRESLDIAYHITLSGEPAYSQRFQRVFGFYEGLAAVIDQQDGSSYHILPNGQPAYPHRWAWCGNFNQGRCVVVNELGAYCHVDANGRVVGGSAYLYAGDFYEHKSVVLSKEGRWMYVDRNGQPMLAEILKDKELSILTPSHKGIAVVRNGGDDDDDGYFHLDLLTGQDVSQGRRYRVLEPFYNGRAFCETATGRFGIVTEDNRVMLLPRSSKPLEIIDN